MKTTETLIHHTCGHCKRTLPLTAFYINKKTGLPQNYCKECRRAANRQSRLDEKMLAATDHDKKRVVITQIEDPMLRMHYLMKAINTVHESIRRKKARQKEEEIAGEYF